MVDRSIGEIQFLAGKTILIAEDNQINADVLIWFLEMADIRVHHAKDGKQALDMWMKYDVDAIIMDVRMPIMDGLQATKRLRSLEKEFNRQPTPVICLSGEVTSLEIDLQQASGASAHLAKPLQFADLSKMLNTLVIPHTVDENYFEFA